MQTPTLGPHPLPNLRSITWWDHSWDSLPFLRLFLNPGLVDVDIRFPDNNLHVYRRATISLIPARDLTDLRLQRMGPADPLSMDAVYNLLEQASETLRSVDLGGDPSVAIIEKLLQLPNLRHLDVILPETRIPPPAVVFPSLEELIVSYGEAASWVHVLRNIPNPALRELQINFSGSSPAYFQTLGPSLLDANVDKTLKSLKCICKDGILLTEAGLRPFISFGRLTKLHLNSPCTEERCNFQLNDSIISELAAALPRLTSVELGGTPCKVPTSDVTISSLVALSTHCIDLDSLQLHFNAKDIIYHNLSANSQTHKFSCKLRSLAGGSQPLPTNHDEILLVTFTILRIFPHLETISKSRQNWDQVRRAVLLFYMAPKTIPLLTAN